jgi:hypothetical protein
MWQNIDFIVMIITLVLVLISQRGHEETFDKMAAKSSQDKNELQFF